MDLHLRTAEAAICITGLLSADLFTCFILFVCVFRDKVSPQSSSRTGTPGLTLIMILLPQQGLAQAVSEEALSVGESPAPLWQILVGPKSIYTSAQPQVEFDSFPIL